MSIPNETVTRSLARFFLARNSRTHNPISELFVSTAAEMRDVASAADAANGCSFVPLSAPASPLVADEATSASFEELEDALRVTSGLPPAHPPNATRSVTIAAPNDGVERTIFTSLSIQNSIPDQSLGYYVCRGGFSTAEMVSRC